MLRCVRIVVKNAAGLRFLCRLSRVCLTALGICIVTSLGLLAQVQDSVFLPQNISLTPKGVSVADARCLNEQLPRPESGDLYRQITHGKQAAFVVIGGSKIPLEDAIAQGKVAFRGLTTAERLATPPRGGDHLRVAVQNLTNEPLRLVFEDVVSLSADTWLHDNTPSDLDKSTWALLRSSLKADPTKNSSWNVTTPVALLRDFNKSGISTESIRAGLGLARIGGMDKQLLDKLSGYKPVAALPLDNSPAWLLSDSSGHGLIFRRGNGGGNGRGSNGEGKAARYTDPEPGPRSYSLVIEKADVYLAGYGAKRRAKLEALSKKANANFLVAAAFDKRLEMITPEWG